jgi:hypothetical protein
MLILLIPCWLWYQRAVVLSFSRIGFQRPAHHPHSSNLLDQSFLLN